LGIPLWLIAIALLGLFRVRSKVKQIPQSFDCTMNRVTEPGTEPDKLPRYTARAHWVHDVLVLHGGNPFLIATTPYGVTEVLDGRLPVGSASRLKRMSRPTALQLRTDSGALVELVVPTDSLALARGPFGRP
jgi:hypothetical protein